jgi:4a-hydroxytetrahydrobiopterin dehydratase
MTDLDLAALTALHCEPRKGKEHALDAARVSILLALLPGWKPAADGKSIAKDFRFRDFHETLGFINAVGWMANRQDHHPDLEAGYNHCTLHWSTHDVGGLSMNDFICAAQVEAIAST